MHRKTLAQNCLFGSGRTSSRHFMNKTSFDGTLKLNRAFSRYGPDACAGSAGSASVAAEKEAGPKAKLRKALLEIRKENDGVRKALKTLRLARDVLDSVEVANYLHNGAHLFSLLLDMASDKSEQLKCGAGHVLEAAKMLARHDKIDFPVSGIARRTDGVIGSAWLGAGSARQAARGGSNTPVPEAAAQGKSPADWAESFVRELSAADPEKGAMLARNFLLTFAADGLEDKKAKIDALGRLAAEKRDFINLIWGTCASSASAQEFAAGLAIIGKIRISGKPCLEILPLLEKAALEAGPMRHELILQGIRDMGEHRLACELGKKRKAANKMKRPAIEPSAFVLKFANDAISAGQTGTAVLAAEFVLNLKMQPDAVKEKIISELLGFGFKDEGAGEKKADGENADEKNARLEKFKLAALLALRKGAERETLVAIEDAIAAILEKKANVGRKNGAKMQENP